MIKRILFLLILVFLFPTISTLCEEGQIDINNASLEELDEIVHIGLSRAEQMITLRPFSSVDDMIRISGIGEIYLEAIKEQGLACVDGETNTNQETPEDDADDDEDEEEDEESTTETISTTNDGEASNGEQQPITAEIIKLNPQTIKSEDDGEINKNLSDYAIYGFVVFCVLLGFLFALKKYKVKKNETEI